MNTDQKRLAKLYGVKGLPFSCGSNYIYWMKVLIRLGIKMSMGEYYDLYKRVVKDD